MGHRSHANQDDLDILSGLIEAVRAGNLESFNLHLDFLIQRNKNSVVWHYVDGMDNTILHLLLTRKSRFKFNEGQRRSARSSMLAKLLQDPGHARIVNKVNHSGDTVLLKAVKNGYDQVVIRLLGTANITTLDENRVVKVRRVIY
jgi:ankyrin repeat protein